MGMAARANGKAGRHRLGGGSAVIGAALVLGTLLAVGSCGPDRRNTALGPNGDKIDEPLVSNPTKLTLGAAQGNSAQACSLPVSLLVNPGNLAKTSTGYKINGSIFADTGAYGPQRFANGAFTVTTDPKDPSRVLDIVGDGAAVIPFVGALADFIPSINGLRASFGVRLGTELQDLEVPVPSDDRCYFLIQLIAGEGQDQFTATSASFGFSIGADIKMVLDPSDPLFYFGGSLTTVPGMPDLPISDAALGFSAQGRLESTAKAIPNKIISGHLFLGATFEVPDTPFTISGNIFIRFPDLQSGNPEIVFSLDGSLFLSGDAVTDIFSSQISDLSDAMHIGDGTVIQEIGVQQINGIPIPLPHIHTELGLQTADLIGNMVTAAHLGDVIQGKALASVSGYFDTGPVAFRLEIGAEIGLNLPLLKDAGLDLHLHFLVSTTGEVDWSVGGKISLGPLDFGTDMHITQNGFDFKLHADFNIDIPPKPFQVIYIGMGADIEIGIPTPGAKVSLSAYACFANSLGDDPCLSFEGSFSNSGWCIGGQVALHNWSIDGKGAHDYQCDTAFEPGDYARSIAALFPASGMGRDAFAPAAITIPYRAGVAPLAPPDTVLLADKRS